MNKYLLCILTVVLLLSFAAQSSAIATDVNLSTNAEEVDCAAAWAENEEFQLLIYGALDYVYDGNNSLDYPQQLIISIFNSEYNDCLNEIALAGILYASNTRTLAVQRAFGMENFLALLPVGHQSAYWQYVAGLKDSRRLIAAAICYKLDDCTYYEQLVGADAPEEDTDAY